MLKKLAIENFKCFEELSIELVNLNVFSGVNSTGKSSVIQALLLLRQSFEVNALEKGIYLNGALINIGTGYDLLYRESSDEVVKISIGDDESEHTWEYLYDKDSSFQKLIEKAMLDETSKGKDLNLFKNTFSYVSAERIGPQRSYKNESSHEVLMNNQVGYRGELFPVYLAEKGLKDRVENESAIHEEHQQNRSLLWQTQMWLSEISPRTQITSKNYSDAGVVSMSYGEHSPLNVGFGLSYVAPVIVSLLKAKKGDLVILENPEAHLHPKGQRKMGELISRACAGGVQVIVETHSDHLLNGIRLAVKNKVISRHDVRLNYFYQEQIENKWTHQKCSPAILDDGSLSDWPDGFFDEWDKAIDELF